MVNLNWNEVVNIAGISKFTIQRNFKKFSDGILYFYGEKIDGSWYFWDGAYLVCPRTNPYKALTYSQLHKIVLNNMFGSYYKMSDKEIENWFDSHFEGPGWGKFEDQGPDSDWFLKGKRFKTRKEYFEWSHKRAALGIWAAKAFKDSMELVEKH